MLFVRQKKRIVKKKEGDGSRPNCRTPSKVLRVLVFGRRSANLIGQPRLFLNNQLLYGILTFRLRSSIHTSQIGLSKVMGRVQTVGRYRKFFES